jgi:hypothetical protein
MVDFNNTVFRKLGLESKDCLSIIGEFLDDDGRYGLQLKIKDTYIELYDDGTWYSFRTNKEDKEKIEFRLKKVDK